MTTALDYLPSITVGTQVSSLTGKSEDGFAASGFSAFITSLTGTSPTVVSLSGKRAKLVLSKDQVVTLQKWLDKQFVAAVAKPKTPPSLELELNPVIMPFVLKYAVPAAVLVFIGGWLAHYYLSR